MAITITDIGELLAQGFTQKAMIAAVLAGFVCGFVGPFLVWRRLGQLGNAVSHAALTPIGIAYWLQIPFHVLLFPFSIGLSILLARLEEKGSRDSDSALSIFFVGMMALGILILSMTGRGSSEAIHILFGDILFVSVSDLFLLGSVSIVAVTYIAFNRRELLLMMLNSDLAAVDGVRVRTHSYALMAICGITVAAALKLMGAILMTSLFLVPPLIAARMTSSLKLHLSLSILIGMGLSIGGFLLSLAADLPSGASIATLGLLVFLMTGLLPTSKLASYGVQTSRN